MTKEQIEQKIKEILAKDKRYEGAKVSINFREKKKYQLLNRVTFQMLCFERSICNHSVILISNTQKFYYFKLIP